MGRIITDDVFAAMIAHLQRDESVLLFQKLLMSAKTAEINDTPEESDGAEITGIKAQGVKNE